MTVDYARLLIAVISFFGDVFVSDMSPDKFCFQSTAARLFQRQDCQSSIV